MARQYLYSPPDGYYDLPMFWPYNGSTLVANANALNQKVSVYAGYGDFVLRRIVGLDRVLTHGFGGVGQYQIRDARGRYLQEIPQYVGTGGPGGLRKNSAQLAIVREIEYKENTAIAFDLWNTFAAADPGGLASFGAQLGFQGVRRQRGVDPFHAGYRYRPKTYTYLESLQLNSSTASAPGNTQTIALPIINYDFELHELRIVYNKQATYTQSNIEPFGIFIVYAVAIGAAGNGITLNISSPSPTPNQPLTISVAGTTITISLQTDSLGNTLTTTYTLAQAINSNIAASALVSAFGSPAPPYPLPVENEVDLGTFVLAGGGAALNLNQPYALIQLYDQSGTGIFYSPAVDLFINRLSYYVNGAFVPPIVYQKDTQLKIDVQSILPASSAIAQATFHFVGKQRYPC